MRTVVGTIVAAISLCASSAWAETCPEGRHKITIDALSKNVTVDGTDKGVLKRQALCIEIINKNPYKYIYQLKVDETEVTSGNIGAVIGALAQLAGLPTGVLAAASAGAPKSIAALIETARASVKAVDPAWVVPSTCPTKAGAQQYLDSLRLSYVAALEAVTDWSRERDSWQKDSREYLATFATARAVMHSDGTEVALRGATATVKDKSVNNLIERVNKLNDMLADAAFIVSAVPDIAAEYQRLYPGCASSGVYNAAHLKALPVKELSATTAERLKELGEAAVDIKLAKAADADPNSFSSVHHHFTAIENGYVTVTLNRGKVSDTATTVFMSRRLELGDTKRFRVSAGFVYGKSFEARTKYHPVTMPRDNTVKTTTAETPTDPPGSTTTTTTTVTTTPGGTFQAVALESHDDDLFVPVGLIHMRLWHYRFVDLNLSFGGGPSGSDGAFAVAPVAGVALFIKDRVVVNGGAVWVVDHLLPAGVDIGSELPATATSVPTTRKYVPGWYAGLTFRIY